MIRFFETSSRLFRIAVCCFITVTFADAANLDDLVANTIVVHDDASDEAIPLLQTVHLWTGIAPATSHSFLKGSASGKKLFESKVTVVFDQDSPSLAADQTIDHDLRTFLPIDDSQTIDTFIQSNGQLHLRLCSLLL